MNKNITNLAIKDAMDKRIPIRDSNGNRSFNSGEAQIIMTSSLPSIITKMETEKGKIKDVDIKDQRLRVEKESVLGIIDGIQAESDEKGQELEEMITATEGELKLVQGQKNFVTENIPLTNSMSLKKDREKVGKLRLLFMGLGMVAIDLFVIGILNALYRETMSEDQLLYRIFAIVGISIFLLAIEYNYRKTENGFQRILLGVASIAYLSAVLTILVVSFVSPAPETSLIDEWSIQEVVEETAGPNGFLTTYCQFAGFFEFGIALILFIISRFFAIKPINSKKEEEVIVENYNPKDILDAKETTLIGKLLSLNNQRELIQQQSLKNIEQCLGRIQNCETEIKQCIQSKNELDTTINQLETEYNSALNSLMNDLSLYKAKFEEFMNISSPIILELILEKDITNFLNINKL
ncbi:hypothetical protein LJB85_02370 [Porphyromonadaceae bacterium OttesenSCG-928-L07]|nr:hypothetical protein [Porphyromonadaceae bacterium OttesenSCG-928-L07]